MNRDDESFNSDPLPDITIWTMLRAAGSGIIIGFAWGCVIAAIIMFVCTVIAGLRYLHL